MHGTMLHRTSLLILSMILVIVSQQAVAQAGHLDPTFGQGGIVTTDFGIQTQSGNTALANAAVVQPDGKIVVVGGVPSHTGFPIAAVARYNSNGSLDTTFGSSGVVSISTLEAIPFTSVTLQSDGKIVAVAGGFDASVVRFTAAGVLDSTFGTGGIVTLDFNQGPSGSGVLVLSNGNILLANGKLIQLLPSGALDTSFGSNGAARTAGFGATALALLPSGMILVTSSQTPSGFLSRYDSNGTLDTTFGIGGQSASPGTAPGLALLSSGDFIVGGSLTNNVPLPGNGLATVSFAVSRYLSSGVMDSSFGTNGGTTTPVPNYVEVATSGLGVDPSGNEVLVGTTNQTGVNAFALARYTSSGQLDTSFGSNGIVVTTFGGGIQSPSVSANGLTIQSDGKIVVVGNYSVFVPRQGFDTAFKIIRYLGQ
jgi:uncharacterized delta-60 repeat protein